MARTPADRSTRPAATRGPGGDAEQVPVGSYRRCALDARYAPGASARSALHVEALGSTSAARAAGLDESSSAPGESNYPGVPIANDRSAERAEDAHTQQPRGDARGADDSTRGTTSARRAEPPTCRNLPEPGRWYDDPAEFNLLDSGARPRRPVEPDVSNNFHSHPGPTSDRQRVRARPSVEPLAPWGGRFYWCAFCNYLNTEPEKGSARCPRHKQDWERRRKAAQRASASAAAQASAAEPKQAGQHEETQRAADFRELAASARRARQAARTVELGLTRPVSAHPMRARDRDAEALLKATQDLLRRLADMTDRPPNNSL